MATPRPARGGGPTGFVLVDKSVGPSSFAAVQQVRRTLGIGGRRGTKGGHAGTLDPFADGLLVVLLGRATRLMPLIVGHDKRYLVGVRFGASSDTDDLTGELVPSAAPMPDEAAIEAALATLRASTQQLPPAVSAIHIDGERAYERARRGESFDVPTRTVRFDAIDIVERRHAADGATELVLDVRCGSGTYMRALARDLGALVGCPAHCSSLRRLEVGDWSVEDAVPAEHVTLDDIRDPSDLVPQLPRVELDATQVRDAFHGRRVHPDHELATGTTAAALDDAGRLVAICEVLPGGQVQPRTMLVDAIVDGVAGSAS